MERVLRLIDGGPGEPAYNMAVDEVLLEGAAARPTLRLYAWEPAAVSLGCFQEYRPFGPRPVVRRITGGGAILHGDELTFAIAAPLSFLLGSEGRSPDGGGVRASFRAVNAAVALGLSRLGVAIEEGVARAGAAAGRGRAPGAPEAFLCYERASDTDVRVGGRKLVGSAQRRMGRSVLQHGSIPLGAEDAAVPRVTVSAAAGRRVRYDEVARAVADGFRDALGAAVAPGALSPEEALAAARLARERYGADSWTMRR